MPEYTADYIADAFECNKSKNHRTMVALIGEGSKQHIPEIHKRLTGISTLNNIIWAYKNGETAIENIEKKQKIEGNENKLMKWLKINSPEHIIYKEAYRMLGRTCDMLILQDFEMITPNILITAIETVKGGGLIILLLDQAKTLREIIETRNELHEGSRIEPVFNKRLFRLLVNSTNSIFIDKNMQIMNITEKKDKISKEKDKTSEERDKTNDKKDKIDEEITNKDVLAELCKTEDQLRAFKIGTELIEKNEEFIATITAARGRGKTALLGLMAAFSISLNNTALAITALALENVQAFFEYLVRGLEQLGWKRESEFKFKWVFVGKKRMIAGVEIIGKTRGVQKTSVRVANVRFIEIDDAEHSNASILFVDEAAAIPLDKTKRIMKKGRVFLSTTVGGYEGTGRSFSTKLINNIKSELANRNSKYGKYLIKEIEMTKPIRYGEKDPIEEWLNRALLLNPVVFTVKERPLPRNTQIFHLNKQALFSGNNTAEEVLTELFGIFASSHYKNTPNDLQVLADHPNQEIFVMLGPSGRILSGIQLVFEGPIDLCASKREGNLIPWLIYEGMNSHQFAKEFASMCGIRVVRIAVHPHLFSMGYGTEILHRVENIWCDAKSSQALSNSVPSSHYINLCDPLVLFSSLDSISTCCVDWIGTSFGLTEQLFRFWQRAGYEPVCIKQKPSNSTGEFSALLLKNISTKFNFSSIFLLRFINLLSYSFRNLQPSLVLSLIHSSKLSHPVPLRLSPDSVSRLSFFSNGSASLRSVLDLIPQLASSFFLSFDLSGLSVLQQSVLLMIGLQHISPECVAKQFRIEEYQVDNLIRKAAAIILANIT